jgi:hypothetical protein
MSLFEMNLLGKEKSGKNKKGNVSSFTGHNPAHKSSN